MTCSYVAIFSDRWLLVPPPNDGLNQVLFIGKVMIELAFTGTSSQANSIKARAPYTLLTDQLSGMSKDALTTAAPSRCLRFGRNVQSPLSFW